MELIWILLLLAGVGSLCSLFKWLIDLGWEKGGKWLTAAYIVNTICLIVILTLGVYVLIEGVARFFDQSWPLALAFVGAVAYVACFYNVKDEAKRRNELSPKNAEEILRQFAEAFERDGSEKGIARYESRLPCSKERIKQAAKVALAYIIQRGAINHDYAKNLLSLILHIGSFVPDEKAKRINSNPSLHNEEYREFNQIDVEARAELDRFIEQVEAWDTTDPLFLQKAYTLIGLEYSKSVKRSFQDYDLDNP